MKKEFRTAYSILRANRGLLSSRGTDLYIMARCWDHDYDFRKIRALLCAADCLAARQGTILY